MWTETRLGHFDRGAKQTTNFLILMAHQRWRALLDQEIFNQRGLLCITRRYLGFGGRKHVSTRPGLLIAANSHTRLAGSGHGVDGQNKTPMFIVRIRGSRGRSFGGGPVFQNVTICLGLNCSEIPNSLQLTSSTGGADRDSTMGVVSTEQNVCYAIEWGNFCAIRRACKPTVSSQQEAQLTAGSRHRPAPLARPVKLALAGLYF